MRQAVPNVGNASPTASGEIAPFEDRDAGGFDAGCYIDTLEACGVAVHLDANGEVQIHPLRSTQEPRRLTRRIAKDRAFAVQWAIDYRQQHERGSGGAIAAEIRRRDRARDRSGRKRHFERYGLASPLVMKTSTKTGRLSRWLLNLSIRMGEARATRITRDE